MRTPTRFILTSENSDSRGPREGAQDYGIVWVGGVAWGWGGGGGGAESEVGTSCNAFALPPCHSINVVVK